MAKKWTGPKTPWWAKLEGGDEAIAGAHAYNNSPSLQNIWMTANHTRLKEDPALYGAITAAGMPYAEARRLDIANQSERALKSKQILDDAGIPKSQQDPTLTSPAQAATLARSIKLEAEKKSHEGFWNGVGDVVSGAAGGIADAAGAVWDAGKNVVSAAGDALVAASSPLTAPAAAGAANPSQFRKDLDKDNHFLAIPILGPVVKGALSWGSDFVGGVAGIADGVDDKQKQDMKTAGYNPDSWTDRYGWYTDLNGPHTVVSNQRVSEAKQQFNPYKVDVARELITSGTLDAPDRVGGLSEDAQRLFANVRQGVDPEGSDIIKHLADQNFAGPGAALAGAYGLDPTSGAHKAVQAVGDLAAYWYVDPLMVAGKAVTTAKAARWGVDFTPEAVKDAIINRPAISGRYDDAIDRIDKIHVLGQTPGPEAAVAAAKEQAHFAQVHPDLMPHYDTLLGMRSGAIQGEFFNPKVADAIKGDKLSSVADLRTNMTGLDRVSNPADYKPIFQLRNGIDDAVTDEARLGARVAIADRLGDALMADAIFNGRPLLKGKRVLPGAMRLSQPMRAATRVFSDRAFSKNGLLFKQLDEATGKGVMDWSKSDAAGLTGSGVVDSAAGGTWIADNYVHGGLRSRAAQAISKFGVFDDASKLSLSGPGSVPVFQNFISHLLPRGQTAFLTNQWARSDPAARSVMKENLWEMLGNAHPAKSTKMGEDFWAQQLKGRETTVLPGATPKEAYSTRAGDMLATPSGNMSAAMLSTQFADGAQLPSVVEVLRNTEKVGVLGWVTGVSHTSAVSRATRVIKVGQVGTPGNLFRQALEGRWLQWLADPAGAVRTSMERMGLAGRNAGERVDTNDTVRQARQIMNSGAMDKLTPLHATGKFDEYADLARSKFDTSNSVDALMRMGSSVQDLASARSAIRLAATKFGGVDWLRARRAALYGKVTSGRDADHAYDWFDKVDTEYATTAENAVFKQLGGTRSHYMDGALVDDMEQIDDGVKAGQRLASIKLANTQAHLGAAGDTGALRWSNTLRMRQSDPVGSLVMQAVARQAVLEQGIGKAGAKFAAGDLDELRKVTGSDPVEVAKHLLISDARGEAYRINGRRGQYFEGEHVVTEQGRNLALGKWAEDMVDDAKHYLGLKTDSALTAGEKSTEQGDLLSKIANGVPITPDDLARVPDGFRPAEVHGSIIVGKKLVEAKGNMGEKLARASSRWYDFVVGRPLGRLVQEPQVLAAHREAMDSMEPLAKALADKGMSHQNIYDLLETGAYGHAINRVFQYSDNPGHLSYFAALSNNFLWYERAMEDFARRAIGIVKADPAVLAKAHLLMEAGLHSGVVDKSVVTDDDGNSKTDYIFTWPGSGLAMRAVNEALQAFGVADGLKVPVWQDFTSSLKYMSPSLQNPLGFTTTPLIGLPMRALKQVLPGTAPTIDTALTAMEGGERSFGSQAWYDSLTPVLARRAINALSADDRDSQFASAFNNALMYYHAAGLLPPTDASAHDQQVARDDIATMVQNNLIMRTVLGTFTPATLSTMGSNVSGIGDGETNFIDQARGVNTIRTEWFQLLEEETKKAADPNQGYSNASILWAQRKHGSILNPGSFTTGTSGQPGDETGKSFSSNLDLTQWMLSNADYLTKYGDAAYSMLPTADGPYYDQTGYRLQLKYDLRQHKTGAEFYDALNTSLGWKDYTTATATRDQAVANGTDPAKVKSWYNDYIATLETSNPTWAAARSRTSTPEYVNQHTAAQVHEMAKATDLPTEIAAHQGELQVMSQLYDDYHAARGKVPGTSGKNARIGLAKKYSDRGDELFKNGPLNTLWSRMKVWED